MPHYTISKTLLADYTKPEDAFAAIVGGTYNEDIIFEFLDTETYTLTGLLELDLSVICPAPYWVKMYGPNSVAGRATLDSNSASIARFSRTQEQVEVYGLNFDLQGAGGSTSGVYHKASTADSKFYVHNCFFIGAGVAGNQDGIHVDRVGDRSVADFRAYNNMFKELYIDIYLKSKKVLGEYTPYRYIWNNTFVKSRYNLAWHDSVPYTDDSFVCITNNIFDLLDNSVAVDINAVADPSSFDKMDYNLYNFRGVGFIWDTYGSLAAFQAAFPTEEVHGIEGDPLFHTYCSDYHPVCGSPAYNAGSVPCVGAVLTSDIDDAIKIGNTLGAYRMECTNDFNRLALPHFDKEQNATVWVEVEDLRSSGDSRNFRVDLDYARIL